MEKLVWHAQCIVWGRNFAGAGAVLDLIEFDKLAEELGLNKPRSEQEFRKLLNEN